MKKIVTLLMASVLSLSLLFVGCSSDNGKETAANNQPTTEQKNEETNSYQYYTADQLKDAIENKKDITLLDIQVKDEYDAHHIKGTIPTYAYPVKTDEDKAKLDGVFDKLNSSENPIVVICPGGAGGATRTIDYLTEKGIKAERLFILEKGQKGWPHKDLLEK